jgi:hypothetical protein
MSQDSSEEVSFQNPAQIQSRALSLSEAIRGTVAFGLSKAHPGRLLPPAQPFVPLAVLGPDLWQPASNAFKNK